MRATPALNGLTQKTINLLSYLFKILEAKFGNDS